jgi:hypothetical protein
MIIIETLISIAIITLMTGAFYAGYKLGNK